MARNLFSVCTRFEASQRPECKHGIVRVTGPRERELSVSSGSVRHTLDPSTYRRRQQLTLKQLSVEVKFHLTSAAKPAVCSRCAFSLLCFIASSCCIFCSSTNRCCSAISSFWYASPISEKRSAIRKLLRQCLVKQWSTQST